MQVYFLFYCILYINLWIIDNLKNITAIMNKKLDRNYYDILDIERTADDAAIKKAYKKAALIYHPDKGGSDEMF